MAREYPKLWNWASCPRPALLSNWKEAPEAFGFYEIGQIEGGRFRPRYAGRAAGTTLKRRLRKHWRSSHNANIRRHRATLYYRYRILNGVEEARFVEAVHLAALRNDDPNDPYYDWNDRQEWSRHWDLEA